MQSGEIGGQTLGLIWSHIFSWLLENTTSGDVISASRHTSRRTHLVLLRIRHDTQMLSSGCHALDLGQYNLFRVHNRDFQVESKAIMEDEWRYNAILVNDHFVLQDSGWVLAFHPQQYIVWGQSQPTVVLWVHYLITPNFCLIWEKAKNF